MTANPTTPIPAPEPSRFLSPARLSVGFGFTVVIIVLAWSALIISNNLAKFSESYWLGLSAPIVIAGIVLAMKWATSDRSKNWPGFVLGLVLLAIFGVLLLLIGALGPNLAWPQFIWGSVVAVIVGAIFTLILLLSWISPKFK